ncbi:MAG: iron-containing alcohol dehydrogenase [Pseudomonadota bacterium]
MSLPDFDFHAPPRTVFRAGAAADLAAILNAVAPARRVLFVTDEGVRSLGLADAALDGLKDAGVAAAVFDAIVADPPERVILDAVEAARAYGADAVVGFGGGSPMDAAKLAAVLAGGDQPLSEMYGVGKVTNKRLPLVLVPTTAGTGSEATPVAVVTTGETTKAGVSSPALIPDVAVLDPDLTLGLPPAITAATGIDAMVHAIEAYTSAVKKNPVSDALAVSALRLLSGSLLAACRDGSNRDARRAMLLGASLAGQAFANAPVAAVHALAYPLGGVFHIPHGLSNALMLESVMRFNAPECAALYSELEAALDPSAVGSDGERADRFVARMARLCDEAGVQRRLRDVGVSHNDLPRLAADAMLQTRLLVNNPRPVDESDARALYEQAW